MAVGTVMGCFHPIHRIRRGSINRFWLGKMLFRKGMLVVGAVLCCGEPSTLPICWPCISAIQAFPVASATRLLTRTLCLCRNALRAGFRDLDATLTLRILMSKAMALQRVETGKALIADAAVVKVVALGVGLLVTAEMGEPAERFVTLTARVRTVAVPGRL